MIEEQLSSTSALWKRAKEIFLSTLQTREEKSQAERHFGMISSVTLIGNTFTIRTQTKFAAELLKRDYADKLTSCFLLAGQGDIVILFEVDEQARPVISQERIVHVEEQPQMVQARASGFISTMPLNPDYTFEEFVRGPSNSFALAAATACAMKPGKAGYNPLFIHGGTGLGKTHLMQAIGNRLKTTDPSLAVCYLTAEAFLNEYVNCINNSSLQEFRRKYRSLDVLLLDDVQFFQKGTAIQEEFFNTFQALQQGNKQIVMTSDVAPKNLPSIEARLISRFEGGMLQEVETPSYETRLAILRKKALGLEYNLPDNALEFIADNIKSHVRAMEGALGKVSVAHAADPSMELNNENLSMLLKDFIEKERTRGNLTIEEIQQAIAKKYNVTIPQILSSERMQSLVTPRQMAMYISRKLTTKSLQEIAKAFDKKHATIIHGVKSIKTRLENERELKEELEEIVTSFGYKITDAMD